MTTRVRRKRQDYHGNIFWVTMTDLFIGMFMIFATLFFAFSANTSQGMNAEAAKATREAVERVVANLQAQNIKAISKAEQIHQTEKGKEKYDVEIDPFTGMAKISDLELFKVNSSDLTPEGQKFLGKFIPIYFDTVLKGDLKKYVNYIVIQGHTDSQVWRGSYTPQEQYMKNMDLSMNRAYKVANFAFNLSKNKPYYNDLTHILRVEGASSSKPIYLNGVEDYDKSRRVELRIEMKEEKFEVLKQFIQGARSKYE